MTQVQANRPLDGITVMGADEIAVGPGQTYWTLLSVPEGPRGPELLNIVEGPGGKRTSRSSGSGSARSAPGASPTW